MIALPIIVKPCGGMCNIACGYCYFNKKEKIPQKEVMSRAILRSMIDSACAFVDDIEFIWHGGEPLLCGIDFFRTVIEFQSEWRKKRKNINNAIQTNGILLTQEWSKFLKENNFTVSISIDGPEEIHNKYRVYKNGQETFKEVIEGLRLAKEFEILSGIICCVNSFNCNFPTEIFNFFVQNNLNNIKFLQAQGRDECGSLFPYAVSPLAYENFIKEIFRNWIELDDTKISIREIESITSSLLGGECTECMFAGECYKYFTVYPNGDIFSCDSLPKVEKLKFGHVADGGFQSIKKSSNYLRLKQRLENLQRQCSDCQWYKTCKGGCLQDWWPNIFSETTSNKFCGNLKNLFDEISKTLQRYNMIK